MNIRLADPNDLETLVRLRLDFIRECFPPQNQAETSALAARLRAFYQEHLGRNLSAALAEEGGRVAAGALMIFSLLPPNPEVPDGRTAEIVNVLTYPEYRRQGLATALVRKLIELAESNGLTRLGLSASAAGFGVYEKMGFRPHGGHTPMHLHLTGRKEN